MDRFDGWDVFDGFDKYIDWVCIELNRNTVFRDRYRFSVRKSSPNPRLFNILDVGIESKDSVNLDNFTAKVVFCEYDDIITLMMTTGNRESISGYSISENPDFLQFAKWLSTNLDYAQR